MKIAFNPSTVAALIAPPNNKDITFDLRGQNIFARGVKFCGTDTNTWRDIKINNVSIDSNILDLRNGNNTTLTNTNGVVTINSTWRPVVDNLTSDSTTSSLSAKQGRVLKALIDGKSNSGHNHDDRYVRAFRTTSNDSIDSDWGQSFKTFDPVPLGTLPEHNPNISLLSIGERLTRRKQLAFIYNNDNIYYRRHNDWGFTNWRRLAFADEIPSSLKNPYALTISLNGASQGPYDGSTAKNINITPSSIGAATSDHNHDGRYVYNYGGTADVNGQALNQNALFMSTTSGITKDWWHILQAARNDEYRWNSQIAFPTQNRNGMYYRSGLNDNTAWGSWVKLLDVNNYSSILDSRYYTESEVNSLLDAKLNRQNLSYGTWNPRGHNLAADYHYNGGDLSISENGGKMYVSIDGYFWQNEGQYRVLDTSNIADLKDNLTVHQYLSATDTTWWPLIWGGSSHANTSDSTGTVYKSHDILSWQTSSQTLYATRLATNSIDLQNDRGIYQVTSGSTSPYKEIQLPDLQSSGIGIFSRVGKGDDEGGIIISANTSVIYNSFDTGWGLSVRDKDLNQTDISEDDTIAFGIRQDYIAYSLGGFEKFGSDNSYVLLGGGGHKLESSLNVANADTVDGYHATSGNNKPWGTIPVIHSSGWMDIGLQLEFHHDNTTGSDYSTILRCTGNYSNIVDLPSANGTLALTSEIPSSLKSPYSLSWDGYNSGSYDGSSAKSFTIPNKVSQLTNDSGYETYSDRWERVTVNANDIYQAFHTYETHGGSNMPNNSSWHQIFAWGTGDVNYCFQLANDYVSNNHLYFRYKCAGTWYDWKTVLDSSNYTGFINNYYWANVKISTSANTQTQPSVNTIYANNWFRSQGDSGWYNESYGGGIWMNDSNWIKTYGGKSFYCDNQIYSSNSIKMGNISLEYTNEINNSANGDLYLNYRNSGNVSLCQGGGNVGIGAIYPFYKLDVDGQVRASGFIHSDYKMNDAVLLAGGGYGRIFMMGTTIYRNNTFYELSFHKLSNLCNNLVWVDGYILNSTSTSFYVSSDFYPYLYATAPSMRTIYRMDENNMITVYGDGLVVISCSSYPRRIGFFYTGRP